MKPNPESVTRFTLFLALLAGAVFAAPAVGIALGEHARRAGAELLVITADVRKLKDASLSKKQRVGLAARINGGLAGLPLMMRLADQERLRQTEGRGTIVGRLRSSLQKNELAAFLATAAILIEHYPFRATGILPLKSSPTRVRRGKNIHEEHCAGCHDAPDLDVERPAFNLFRQARTITQFEFAARLVIGVRGDRTTGIDNPFSDEELAALFAYYRSGTPVDN